MTAIDTNRTPPAPGSEEWSRLVTASKVAAILNLSPWDSPRSTWLKMHGDISWDDGDNKAEKSRGHYLEDGILNWWCDQHPERADQTRQYYATVPSLPWAGATPDLYSEWTNDEAWDPIVVDAKTSRDDEAWGAPGTDEMPPMYAAQLQWAMHLAGARRGYIALLTARLDLREYVIEYDPAVAQGIERICAEFLASLTKGTAPRIDSTVATWKAEKRRHPEINPDNQVQVSRVLARRFVAIKKHEAQIRRSQSLMRDAMGDARHATFDGVVVARRQPNKYGVSLVAVAKSLPTRDQEN